MGEQGVLPQTHGLHHITEGEGEGEKEGAEEGEGAEAVRVVLER